MSAQEQDDCIVVSTAYITGYRIVKTLGFSWGLIVRSRGIGRNIVASLRTLPGGEIKEYTELLNQARGEALERLVEHARSMGANALIGVAFDSSEISQMMSEILAYGTAVIVEKEDEPSQPVRLV